MSKILRARPPWRFDTSLLLMVHVCGMIIFFSARIHQGAKPQIILHLNPDVNCMTIKRQVVLAV